MSILAYAIVDYSSKRFHIITYQRKANKNDLIAAPSHTRLYAKHRNIAYPYVKLLTDLFSVITQICSNRYGKSNTKIQKTMSPADYKSHHVDKGSDSKNQVNDSLKYYNVSKA